MYRQDEETDNEENEENHNVSSETTSTTASLSEMSDSDSDMDDMFDYDNDFNDEERINGNYYIGLCREMFNGNYIFSSAISPSLFLRSSYHNSLQYLIYNSIIVMNVPEIEILQLYIKNNSFYVVKKTFWLRMVQRNWKRVLRERETIYKKRCRIQSILYKEVYGQFPNTCRNLPTLKGMLCLVKR